MASDRGSNLVRLLTLLSMSVLALVTLTAVSPAQERIITASATRNNRTAVATQHILELAYEASGLRLEVEYAPGNCSLYKANNGQADGKLARISKKAAF